jgi:hypothetical protein
MPTSLIRSFALQPEAKVAATLMHASRYRYLIKRDACIGSACMHCLHMHVAQKMTVASYPSKVRGRSCASCEGGALQAACSTCKDESRMPASLLPESPS